MNMLKMMKQAKEMQSKMKDVQKGLSKIEVEGSAGGGAVRVTATGDFQIRKVEIHPDVVDSDRVRKLEDLVLTACRQAMDRAKQVSESEIKKVTGGMSLPGLF